MKGLFHKAENPGTAPAYDIIGDVHGHYSELTTLLSQMDYSCSDGIWQHPRRKAIFVGDFANRGPQTPEVIQSIRAMIQNHKAYAILGNHEINMMAYFTHNKKALSLAEPSPAGKKQMEQIRAQYQGDEEQLQHDVKWLRTLPFFLSFGHLRVVHAHYNPKHIQLIAQSISEGKISKKQIKEIIKGKSEFAQAVNETTRGLELSLPPDLILKDSKNIRRTRFRIKWWIDPRGLTFRDLSFGNRFVLPDYNIPEQILPALTPYPLAAPVVFFGHYCIGTQLNIQSPNLCCVDACVAGHGHLMAYRWDGETELTKEKLLAIPVGFS